MVVGCPSTDAGRMNDPANILFDAGCELLIAAEALDDATQLDGCGPALPATLGVLEEALRRLSSSCRPTGRTLVSPHTSTEGGSRSDGRAIRSARQRTQLLARLRDLASLLDIAATACADAREAAAQLAGSDARYGQSRTENLQTSGTERC